MPRPPWIVVGSLTLLSFAPLAAASVSVPPGARDFVDAYVAYGSCVETVTRTQIVPYALTHAPGVLEATIENVLHDAPRVPPTNQDTNLTQDYLKATLQPLNECRMP